MPRPEWSNEARGDLREVLRFIAADNPAAARRMKALIERKVDLLAEHPHLGPPGRVDGTRELHAHRSYRLIYAVAGRRVRILRLVHTARRWP